MKVNNNGHVLSTNLVSSMTSLFLDTNSEPAQRLVDGTLRQSAIESGRIGESTSSSDFGFEQRLDALVATVPNGQDLPPPPARKVSSSSSVETSEKELENAESHAPPPTLRGAVAMSGKDSKKKHEDTKTLSALHKVRNAPWIFLHKINCFFTFCLEND